MNLVSDMIVVTCDGMDIEKSVQSLMYFTKAIFEIFMIESFLLQMML